jgi:hypothetical protein
VSGTRTGIPGDDLGDNSVKITIMDMNTNRKCNLYGAGEETPVPTQVVVVKWAPLRRHLRTMVVLG